MGGSLFWCMETLFCIRVDELRATDGLCYPREFAFYMSTLKALEGNRNALNAQRAIPEVDLVNLH